MSRFQIQWLFLRSCEHPSWRMRASNSPACPVMRRKRKAELLPEFAFGADLLSKQRGTKMCDLTFIIGP